MRLIELLSLPEILFSHVYQAETYRNRFPVRKGFLEISYVAEGSVTVTVGAEQYCARKGDLICFLPDTETAVSADGFHCHHTVGARVEWCPATDERSALLLPAVLPSTDEVRRIIDDCIHHSLQYKELRVKGAAKLLELLCAVDKACRKVQKADLPGERLYAERAKAYIQDHIREPLTQAAVAEHLGVSPAYLCAVFKKAEGMPLMRYVNRLKLENIKALMEHTRLHLYEAAALYGYSDPNYVSRLYKRLFGYNITDKPRIHPEIKNR